MRIPFAVLLFFLASCFALAAELALGRFSAGDLSGWKDESFRGKDKTAYSLVEQDGRKVVEARSRHSASGLLKKVDLDPAKYPLLRWSWKIAHTVQREDVSKKGGDDFAARVYLVFPGTFFWRTRALNYVWSARIPQNTVVPSPYTANVAIVAVESGDRSAGTWKIEERNIRDDFRRAFGEEPPRIGAIAIMTDTDDTGDEASAWYGDIFLASQ